MSKLALSAEQAEAASRTVLRGDELGLTMRLADGQPLLALEVARMLTNMSRLLVEVGKSVAPGQPMAVVLSRVDILDNDCRLIVRVIPKPKRRRRKRSEG